MIQMAIGIFLTALYWL